MGASHKNLPRSVSSIGEAAFGLAPLRSAGDHRHAHRRSECWLFEVARGAGGFWKGGIVTKASGFCFPPLVLLLAGGLFGVDARPLEHGRVAFVPTAGEVQLPEAFRQAPHDFAWQ